MGNDQDTTKFFSSLAQFRDRGSKKGQADRLKGYVSNEYPLAGGSSPIMRKVTLGLILTLSLASIIGCGGSSTALTAANPAANTDSLEGVPASVMAAIDAQAATRPSSVIEVIDAETGALVLREELARNADGSVEMGIRGGQSLNIDPLLNQVFRIQLNIDTDGPTGKVPRGYTSAGNPLYYVGDTIVYDSTVQCRMPGRARWMSRLGAFDIEYRHLFGADNSLLPECIPGTNPLTIQDVDFIGKTPAAGPYGWSVDGMTFGANEMQFQLCNLPGLQFGTDLINARLYWVVPGTVFGLPCNSCEVRCMIYDRVVGIYDPPGE